MKISKVPRDSRVVIQSDVGRVPYTFIKLDGMYAQLRTYDWKLAYVPAWTEVTLT